MMPRMAFLALFFRESSKQTCLQPDSGVYSIETSEARPPPNHQSSPTAKVLSGSASSAMECSSPAPDLWGPVGPGSLLPWSSQAVQLQASSQAENRTSERRVMASPG